jgi:hypothetical protein
MNECCAGFIVNEKLSQRDGYQENRIRINVSHEKINESENLQKKPLYYCRGQ